jgi:O-acetyl-ADP-ribose deacetylase (regulator of RNase III)
MISSANIIKLHDYLESLYGYKFKKDIPKNLRDAIEFYLITNIVHLPDELNEILNEMLQSEIVQKPVIDSSKLSYPIALYKGDITQLKIDAIVNGTDEDGLGCFTYGHSCLDNVIYRKAGPELRIECMNILSKNKDKKIRTSDVIVTGGHNLFVNYILHTNGPIYNKSRHNEQCLELAKCYINCLNICRKLRINSIAFSCISTGIYKFPNDIACNIAINTVIDWLKKNKCDIQIIFCVYDDLNYKLYKKRLSYTIFNNYY